MGQTTKEERMKHQAYYEKDSDFAGYARLLQSKWREKKDYPIGKSANGTVYGNYVDLEYAKDNKCNFLTEKIKKLVADEIRESKKTGAVIKEPRIWNNLLTSQALCFNLFGELHSDSDMELATAYFKNLFPDKIDRVTAVLFEYSPCRGDQKFTGDKSAFDAFIEYTSKEGKKGFIGIEVKYAESLREESAAQAERIYESHEKQYLEWTTAAIFKPETIDNLRKPPLSQIWRDHLLSISILGNELYDEGFFVFLFPKENKECYEGVQQYCQQLTFPNKKDEEKTGFYWRYLDDFIDELHNLVNNDWTKELKERYLGR